MIKLPINDYTFSFISIWYVTKFSLIVSKRKEEKLEKVLYMESKYMLLFNLSIISKLKLSRHMHVLEKKFGNLKLNLLKFT